MSFIAYWNGAYQSTNSNLSILGTITTGTWNASTIGPGYGGTGQSTYTIGDILYSGAANSLSKLAGNTTTTRKFLRSVATTAGTATAPAWDTLTAADIPDISGTYATNDVVNGLLAAADAMIFKGLISNTTSLPNTHNAGWTYRVATAGTYPIVDSNGKYCEIGTLIICIADGTTATPAHWTAVETNEDGSVIGPASSTDNAIARFDGESGRIIQNSKTTLDDNGHIAITHVAGSSTEFEIKYGTTIDYWWGVGTGNENHGMYDVKKSAWVISAGTDNVWSFVGNASTATTLAASKTLWGQSFNGGANVTGSMTNVGPQMKLPADQSNFQFLTSTGGAANGQFGKIGLNSSYSSIDFTNYVLDVNGGKTKLNNTTAATTSNLSSQLIVANTNGGMVALELWRNSNASWQIANDGGILYIRNNWTTAKQNTYSQNGLIMDFNTGNTAIAGTLSVGQTTRNTTYKLHVNGTSYFNGLATVYGSLRIGTADTAGTGTGQNGYATANSGSNNYIAFYGVYGDNPGSYNHTYIGESIYGAKTTANELSELLLFHGNDPGTGSGPDRIRLFAGQVDIQVYTAATSGTWDVIRATTGTQVANFANGQMTLTGHLLTATDTTYDIGATATRWRSAYLTTSLLVGAKSTITAYNSNALGSCVGAGVISSCIVTPAAGNGYYLYGKGVEYGRAFINAIGVAGTATTTYTNQNDSSQTTPGYSGAVTGTAYLVLGNNKAAGVNGSSYSSPGSAGTADNAQGYLRLYSNKTGYADITSYTSTENNTEKTRLYPVEGISIPENKVGIMFRPGLSSYYTYTSHQTSGNEALVFATSNTVTSFIFVNGEGVANIAADRWTKLDGSGASGKGPAPGLQIKNNCVSIGKLIANASTPTYKLQVYGGQIYFNNNNASSTTNLSGHLIIANENGGNVSIELWRNSNASWQIANEGGNLYFRNNWTTAKQNTYTQTSLSMNYNTGNATFAGSVTATGGFSGALTGNVTGNVTGNAATVSRATFGDSSNGEHNCNNINSNGLWYYTSNGPSGLGNYTDDGALYSQAYSTSWVGQIAQDYRTGSLFVRSKNNGTWQSWRAIPSGMPYTMTSKMITYDATASTITKIGTTNAWDSQFYSNVGYKECKITFRAGTTGKAIMIGLNSDPSTDANYTSIDYCWYLQNGSTPAINIYESGTSIASITGHTTYAVGDEFSIEYTDGYVCYYHNGVCCRRIARAIGNLLYADSSFHGTGGIITNFSFEPIAMTIKDKYVKLYNNKNFGNNSSATFTDLAAAGNAVGMINAATDNPEGSAKWVHGISLCWEQGVTSSWISQIALGVASGRGMWYRTTSGNIAGAAWKRVLDSSNYNDYAPTKTGTGASGSWGISVTGNAATATKVAAKLASDKKTYLLGTQTAITATAANVDLTGDTGVYLWTDAGSLSAKSYMVNDGTSERVVLQWNSTDQSLDFVFA